MIDLSVVVDGWLKVIMKLRSHCFFSPRFQKLPDVQLRPLQRTSKSVQDPIFRALDREVRIFGNLQVA